MPQAQRLQAALSHRAPGRSTANSIPRVLISVSKIINTTIIIRNSIGQVTAGGYAIE